MLTAVVLPPYLAFLAMAFWGMVRTRRGWRDQFPLYALILGINGLVAITYGATRYGIGMAPALCLYTAAALDALLPGIPALSGDHGGVGTGPSPQE